MAPQASGLMDSFPLSVGILMAWSWAGFHSCWEGHELRSLSSPEDTISLQSSMDSNCLSTSSPVMVPKPWRDRWSWCPICAWLLHWPLVSALWPVLSFCSNYHPLKKETILMGPKSSTNLLEERYEFIGLFDSMSIYQDNSWWVHPWGLWAPQPWVLNQIFSTNN